MKKYGTMNSEISRVISYLRHTDSICISDCGLPCPDLVELIDLSLKIGEPSFLSVLKELEEHMVIEKVYLAEEIKNKNKEVLNDTLKFLSKIEVEYLSHEFFKNRTRNCKAIIRTGEATPYANIILQSGCLF